jgi:hypothetical protein
VPPSPQILGTRSQSFQRARKAALWQAWASHCIKCLPDDEEPSAPQPAKKDRLEPSGLITVNHCFDILNDMVADISPMHIYNVGETAVYLG